MISREQLEQIPLVQKHWGDSPQEKVALQNVLSETEWEYYKDYPIVSMVYLQLDTIQPIILSTPASHPETGISDIPSFKEMLLGLPELNFSSILLLSTLYGRPSLAKMPFTEKFQGTPVPVVEEILADTMGYVVYAHQLEQLYCMVTGADTTSAIQFRKDWNKKIPKARLQAMEIEISSGYSLAQLMNERTMEESQFVYNANFSGAYTFWRYLIGSIA